MTRPPSRPPSRPRLFTPTMLGGIAVVVALAITVVIVLLTRDTSGDEADSSQSASTSSAPPTYSPNPDFSTSSGFGLTFDFPAEADQFDPDQWSGPDDGSIQGTALEGLVRYPACDASDGGNDLSAALMEAAGDDVSAATVAAMDQLAEITLGSGADYETTDYDDSDVTDYTTGGGIDGGLLTATLTDPDPDECDTDTYELITFVTDQPSGVLVALVIVYRGNGETAASPDELADYADEMIASLREE